MSLRIGFDNEKYLSEQTSAILERVRRFDNKLYLEFGGKLLFDYPAARILPGKERGSASILRKLGILIQVPSIRRATFISG